MLRVLLQFDCFELQLLFIDPAAISCELCSLFSDLSSLGRLVKSLLNASFQDVIFFLKEHQRVINSLVIPFWFLRGTGIFFFWGHESNGGLLKCGHQGLPRKICTFSSFKDATLGTIIHRLCLSVWSV